MKQGISILFKTTETTQLQKKMYYFVKVVNSGSTIEQLLKHDLSS